MAAVPDLVLRDIHQPPAPDWWPPAPGWWWLAGVLVCLGIALLGWRLLRAWRRRYWIRLFDGEVDTATGTPAKIAAMSGLLRRASRRRDPAADRLAGDDWLTFLDTGQPGLPFTTGIGRELHDGPFRRDADAIDVRALQSVARVRFVALMTGDR
ncbi:MAG: DUF4381 domain-containing protein [Luteimonas sp.]